MQKKKKKKEQNPKPNTSVDEEPFWQGTILQKITVLSRKSSVLMG